MAPPPRQGGGGTRAPALTYLSAFAGVVVHVLLLYTWSCLIVVVLSCRTVCHPHSSSNDIACVVVRSRDSTLRQVGSSTFSLCERSWAFVITILTLKQDQRLIDCFAIFTRPALVARFTRVSGSENPRAPSLHLWATSSGMSNRTSPKPSRC